MRSSSPRSSVQEIASTGQAVLADIAQQIVEHPPEEPPRPPHTKPLGAQIKNRLDLRILQPVGILRLRLTEQDVGINCLRMDRQIAGRRLGGLNEVLPSAF